MRWLAIAGHGIQDPLSLIIFSTLPSPARCGPQPKNGAPGPINRRACLLCANENLETLELDTLIESRDQYAVAHGCMPRSSCGRRVR